MFFSGKQLCFESYFNHFKICNYCFVRNRYGDACKEPGKIPGFCAGQLLLLFQG